MMSIQLDSISSQTTSKPVTRHPQRPKLVLVQKNQIHPIIDWAKKDFTHKYHFLRTIHSQDQVNVFLAQERSTQNTVVVKQFLKNSIEHQSTTKSEINILKALSHPNILEGGLVYEDNYSVYLVTHYFREGDLSQRIISNGKLSEAETKRIMAQLFGAVHYLHMKEIVHRDLKPENIFIENVNPLNTRIGDFGSAVVGRSGHKQVVGTAYYIAPEVRHISSEKGYGSSCDLWSLGVIMHVCLTGVFPTTTTVTESNGEGFDWSDEQYSTISPQALQLLKSLLVVDPDRRITCKMALQSEWFVGGRKSLCGISSCCTIQ